jgi:hypothetical protein
VLADHSSIYKTAAGSWSNYFHITNSPLLY